VTRERGDLDSALAELQAEGVDYVVVEGFKKSRLPKIAMADIDVPNMVRRVRLNDVNEGLVEELTEMILGMEDYDQ
jgi:molybdopterin synthase catalytic subunit